MQERLDRYFWILNLLTLAAVAYLAADGTSELVAAEIESALPEVDDREQRQSSIGRHRLGRQAFRKRDGTPILRRNIFDSAVGPIFPTADSQAEIDQLDPGELPIRECKEAGDVQVQVLATVVSESDPSWSFASTSVGKEARLVRLGDEVDGRTVSGISWRYLFLRGSRDECYIDLFGEQRPPKKRPRGGKLPSRAEIKDGIKVVGPNERVVDRSLLDQALANPAKFARSVRVRPYKRNGEVQGFRIRRVKKDSPLYLLGARQGDVFHSVNGVGLTSVDQALAAYQSMRNESQLVFDITRKGRPQQLKITVQ